MEIIPNNINSFGHSSCMQDYIHGTERLAKAMQELEHDIAREAELLKSAIVALSQSMPEDASYFLNGIQTGPVVKSYLLTRRGIEIPGEQTIAIPEFFDNVLRFANYPNKKIEVLRQLALHIQNIEQAKSKTQETQKTGLAS